FLSYAGSSTGPDAINAVTVRPEFGNSIYVAGSFTQSGRTVAFAAKLTEGATAVVWSRALVFSGVGPDTVSSLALSGNSVYLAGNIAAPYFPLGTDGFVTQLN